MNTGLLTHIKRHRDELLAVHRYFAKFLARVPPSRHNFNYLVLRGALRRSYFLTRAFFHLVEEENFVAAAPLVRLELDNGLRMHLVALCRDQRKALEHVAAGKRLDQLRDPDGKRLTDRYVVDALSSMLPWLPRLYAEGSRFVHFSDVHIFAFDDDASAVLSERDTRFSEVAYIELVESFVLAAKFAYDFIARYRSTKLREWRTVLPKFFSPHRHRLPNTKRAARTLRRLIPTASRPYAAARRSALDRPVALDASLIRTFFDHGLIVCRLESGWSVVDKRFPAIRTLLMNERNNKDRIAVQLDVEVLLPDATLSESFMGLGAGRSAAVRDAWRNFCISSLHVMLAGLWDRPNRSQLDIDSWRIGDTVWTAYRGHFVIKCNDTSAVSLPSALEDTLAALLQKRKLAGTLHWFRMFYGVVDYGEPIVEALFDNEPWHEMAEAIRALPWEIAQDYFSARVFYILRRDEEPGQLWSGFRTRDNDTA